MPKIYLFILASICYCSLVWYWFYHRKKQKVFVETANRNIMATQETMSFQIVFSEDEKEFASPSVVSDYILKFADLKKQGKFLKQVTSENIIERIPEPEPQASEKIDLSSGPELPPNDEGPYEDIKMDAIPENTQQEEPPVITHTQEVTTESCDLFSKNPTDGARNKLPEYIDISSMGLPIG